MFLAVYDFLVRLSLKGLKILSFVNPSLRKKWKMWEDLGKKTPPHALWVHCASAGEFEQAKPLIQAYKTLNPNKSIVISFFSPSGYFAPHLQKESLLFYPLPPDTKKAIRLWIHTHKPAALVLIKSELWLTLIHELNVANIPVFLYAAHFPKRPFFHSRFGAAWKKELTSLSYIGFQDQESVKWFTEELGYKNISISGDSRIISTRNRTMSAWNGKTLPIAQYIGIAGSVYPEDLQVITAWLTYVRGNDFCLFLFPHHVNEKSLCFWERSLSSFRLLKYSEWHPHKNTDKLDVLLVDEIGLLSSAYRFAQCAYIGGGLRRRIHSVLEPAAFGLSIMTGPNIAHSREASIWAKKGWISIYPTDKERFFQNSIAAFKQQNGLEAWLEAESNVAEKALEAFCKRLP
jgi:3-deoxy-D-manno-octulosonic-acid transferase